jgi:hypothetical protein
MPPIIIRVPEPEPGSFNHKRAAGALLKSQTLHLREALLRHRQEIDEILAIHPDDLKTEGEVSSYIHKATAILSCGAKPSGKQAK